jgi:hypothetical protein
MEMSIGQSPQQVILTLATAYAMELQAWCSTLGVRIHNRATKSQFHRDEFLEARLLFRLAIEVGSNLASEAAVILALHVHKPPIYNPTR